MTQEQFIELIQDELQRLKTTPFRFKKKIKWLKSYKAKPFKSHFNFKK